MNLMLATSAIFDYIPLIMVGIFALFVISGLVWGIIRGLKKQTFRLAWVLVTALILFFVTPYITQGLMNLNITFLKLNIGGIEVITLADFVTQYAIKLPTIGEIIAANPVAVKSVITIASLLLNSFIYVLMFWLTKIVLWPIWAILSATLLKAKTPSGTKKPRQRVWGMLVGTVSGIIVGATTLMPVMGLANLTMQVENSSKNNASTSTPDGNGGLISKVGGSDIVEILNNYYNSFSAGLFRYTGIEFFNNATFNGLSTTTIQSERITLKDEFNAALKVVDSYQSLSKLNFKNYTQESLTKIINTVRTFASDAYDVKTLVVVGNDILPYVIEEMLNNPDFIIKLPNTGNTTVNDVLKDSLTAIKNITFNEIKNELDCVLNIGEALNQQNILAPLLNKEIKNIKSVVDLLDTETINNVTTEVFNMKILGTAMPIAINASINYFAHWLGIYDFELDEGKATTEEVKNLINAVLNIGFETYNSLDFNSKYYITKDTLPLAGQILNAIKDYNGISEQNYMQLINFASNKIHVEFEKVLSSLDAKFDEVKMAVLDAINNLSSITDFEKDFTEINKVYNETVNLINSLTKPNTDFNLSELGLVLDTFKNTTLFGNAVNPIIRAVFKTAKEFVPAGLEGIEPILTKVANNVSGVTSWQTELTKYSEAFSVIKSMSDNPNWANDMLDETNSMLENLGSGLNAIKSSKLFGSEINGIVTVILDYAETKLTNSDMVTNAFAKIKNNLSTATDVNWEKEFSILKKLAFVSDEFINNPDFTIEQVGEKLDEIISDNSVLITRGVVNEVINAAINDITGETTDVELLAIIEKVKISFETNNTISFKQELTALNSLFAEIKDIDSSNPNFEDFGRLLDDFDKTTGGTPSIIITGIRTDIVLMIINKVDTTGFNNDLLNIITKIKTFVPNIKSYQTEFRFLKTFTDEVTNLKNIDVNTFDFIGFGTKLDSYNTSALLSNIRQDVVMVILTEVDNSTADADIKAMVSEMKLKVSQITSYTTEFTKLKEFINERDNFNNVDIDTFDFAGFGAKLDGYGSSVMLKSIRLKIVDKIVDQVSFVGSSEPEITLAVTDIISEIKTTALKVEANKFTYVALFTEIGGLKDQLESLQNVNVNKTNYDIRPFGIKLDELNALTIVPLKSAVRINRFILNKLLTQASDMLPEQYELIPGLKTAFEEFVFEVNYQINLCNKYLNNGAAYAANFSSQYAESYKQISEVVNLIPEII